MKQIIALLAIVALTGCETVTDVDGRRTTRFDGAAFNQGATTVLDGLQRYQQVRDGWTVIGHDPVTGAPIYGYPPRR